MLTITDLKVGRIIEFNGEPYIITYSQHARTAMRKAYVRTKLKHLIHGNMLEKTFNAADKINEADLYKKSANYMYADANNFYFMDEESYEEIGFPKETVGEINNFLTEGVKVVVCYYNDKPVTIELPKKVTLQITETEPGVRGDTAQGSVTKPAKVETGYELHVPIFVNQGDKIIINTETGEYVERAKE